MNRHVRVEMQLSRDPERFSSRLSERAVEVGGADLDGAEAKDKAT
jgi:hypothetical protein